MISFPYAKINLGLNVTERRSDGYHNLETVFYPVEALCDMLEFVPAKTTKLQLLGQMIDGDSEQNLVVRALRLLQNEVSADIPELTIYLRKAIPMGAGLGGGSADAAFMLTMLNSCFALDLSDEQLLAFAARLGADCAFFLKKRVAFATGIGDKLTDLPLSLAGKTLLLACPDIHVSTAEAYAGITPRQWDKPLATVIAQPVDTWRDELYNDFEPSVFATHPILADIKASLYKAGALYAAMSGSGSTLFGIFDKTAKTELLHPSIDYKSFTL